MHIKYYEDTFVLESEYAQERRELRTIFNFMREENPKFLGKVIFRELEKLGEVQLIIDHISEPLK